MEAKVSEVLENILGLMALEGSFEVTEGPEEVLVSIETGDAGRLIGFKGETLDGLQLLVNIIANRDAGENFKRVVVDVAGWRKTKEGDLERRAKAWADEVLQSGKEIDLDPMPSWQRRVVHMVISEVEGVESESQGEGRDRHLVIKPVQKKTTTKKKAAKTEKVETSTEEVVESTEATTKNSES